MKPSVSTSDEQIISEIVDLTQSPTGDQRREEELCWVLLEREYASRQPVVYAEIGVDAFWLEVR